MVVEPDQRESPGATQVAERAVQAFAEASRRIAAASTLDEALTAVAEATAAAAGAELAVVRILDRASQTLTARGVSASSPALAAELEGSRFPVVELEAEEIADPRRLPEVIRRLARGAGDGAVLLLPVLVGDRPLGSVELIRGSGSFEPAERLLARLAADQVGLLVRAFGAEDGAGGAPSTPGEALEIAAEALAAGLAESQTSDRIARLALEVTGARACVLWRVDQARGPVAVASVGDAADVERLVSTGRGIVQAPPGRGPVVVDRYGQGLAALVQLGEPPLGALQLVFAADDELSEQDLERLGTFGARAAHALRSSDRTSTLSVELERTRALLAVVGQAIAELSLSHTLETAVERVAEQLESERVAVYLSESGGLHVAAARGLAGPHLRVAGKLLALGPLRARGVVLVEDAGSDPRFSGVRDAVAEAGIEGAVAVPLLAHEDLIGLLVAYLPRGRLPGSNESALLSALASQLAVAVLNARLHEQAKKLGHDLEQALRAERRSARRLAAFYEISRSFAELLSLDETLEAVARTALELLDADAAVLRMPDERGETLVSRVVHVADERLSAAIRPVLTQPQPLAKLPGRRLFRMRRALVLDAASARSLGASYELLVPFLEKGSTAIVVPIATSSELLATLTLVGLDPARPLDDAAVETALSVADQAALAIDNARLYEQQKDFSDAMQRSLLPDSAPELAGLEVGEVYESSARLDVGGDVYDCVALPDGRLAVVIGDVTGHGIEAAADMALAKFAFRSLAREHPDPGDFLTRANEVVVDELDEGKFITMVYLTVDPQRGEVACATAGHPDPRLVRPDGAVEPLVAHGLALGIERGQRYVESRESLAPGGAVALYGYGVIETRRGGGLYGHERLDRLLAERRTLPAKDLAEAVVADCRAFGGGELSDDCAVVVIKRPAQ